MSNNEDCGKFVKVKKRVKCPANLLLRQIGKDVRRFRWRRCRFPLEPEPPKSRDNANAVWLRLHNDSPLPIEIPTQSIYLPNGKCFFEFTGSLKISGLCNNSKISIWHGLKDTDNKWITFGFDFGSSAILLPKTSVLFPVPLEILKNRNQIVFSFTFQKEINAQKVGDYGRAEELRFGEKDLPQTE